MKKILSIVAIVLGSLSFAHAQSDNPCGAPGLPVNTTCVNTVGNLPAAATNSTGVPAPGCASYSGPDVWYTVTVPASGTIVLNMNTAGGGPTDMGMAIYSGACGGLTLVECDDDDGAGLMPSITHGGLTPGTTLWVRIWEYGGGSFGNFNICATEGASSGCTPPGANSNCGGATPFCGSTINYCNTTGVPSLGSGGPYGCLGSTPNPAFFYLHMATSGAIDMQIQQTATTGGGLDVDFVCWGPFPTQAAMCTGYSAANIVDCSYSAAAIETINIPASATAGQWYLVLITNFSNQPGAVNFSQTGGTGTTDCSITAPCSVSGTPTNIACFGSTGSIAANCTGTAPFTVNVVNASGTTVATQTGAGPGFNFTGLTAGTYTLNMTASSGTPACTNTATVTITGPTAALSASSSHTDVLCTGGCTGTLSSSATGGTPPYSFSWSGALGAGANKVNVCSGTYTVTVTDANGCTSTSTQTIIDPSYTLSTSATNETCSASNGTVTGNAVGAGTITYTWYSDAAHTSVVGTGAGLTGLSGGGSSTTYYLATSNDLGCSIDDSAIVVAIAPPMVNYTVTSLVTGFGLCNASANASTTNGTAPFSYVWSNGVTGPNNNTLCAGPFCVTVTDANGCVDSLCGTLGEPPLLTLSLSGTHPLCNGSCDGTITSTTNGGVPPYSFLWSNGATTPDLNSVCAGSYTLTVTDTNGNTASASFTLTDPALLVLGPVTSTNVSCSGACDGTINAPASGGSGTLVYSIPGLTGGPSYTSVCAGNYLLTVTDSNGCNVSQNISITQPPVLSISMSSVNASCIFPNGSATASVSGGTTPYTYLWSNGATTAVNANITSGNYSVDVTDGNGCTISGTVNVGNNPPLVINVSTDPTICNGQSTSLTATAAGGSGGPYTFSWTDENGNPIAASGSGSSSAITVSPTDSTWYFATVDDGCVASVSTDSAQVNVNPLPQLSFGVVDAAGCSPFTANLQVSTDIGVLFAYDFNCDGVTDLNSEYPAATTVYNDPGTYDVCIKTTSIYGCSTSVSLVDLVTAYPLPVAEFVATPLTASILTPTIQFTDISTGAMYYTWNFGDSTGFSGVSGGNASGDFTSGTVQQPEHIYQDTGTYVVSLLVENMYGCTSLVAHPVVIEPDFEIFAPNAFTPNGDGVNDIFQPIGIGYDTDRYEFYIFDRWGQTIFKSGTFAMGWDGTHNGIMCKSDTYVWKIVVVDFKKIKHTYTGHITLLR